MIKQKLRILSWNLKGYIETIDGIRINKLKEQNILTLFSNYDIVLLQETHLDRDNSKDLFVPGFATGIHYLREKRKKAQKPSGGISVFVKPEIRNNVRFLPQSNSDTVWIHIPATD